MERVRECLEEGDVVQLCSGGFPMTIEHIGKVDAVCVWADKGRIRRDTIRLSVLTPSNAHTDVVIVMPAIGETVEEAFARVRDQGHA